jgi:hypothetical protein
MFIVGYHHCISNKVSCRNPVTDRNKMKSAKVIRFSYLPGIRQFLSLVLCVAFLLVSGCQAGKSTPNSSFTLAVIPDTQNYIDFRHQKAEGFELDSSALFIEQMQYIADHSTSNGGNIVFATAVGDVWQHQTRTIDAEHLQRGIGIEPNPILARNSVRVDQVLKVEIPKAIEGYRIISQAGLPFAVAPGNHDYDAMWSVSGYPPRRDKKFHELERIVEDMGMLHVGGLDNFRSAFGETSDFFNNKPWYIASHNGGANSAQRFMAGGYRFLHLALEMQPGDDVISWVESVLSANPGLPTIITTHDYLNASGERQPQALVDLARVDSDYHNSAEQIWDSLFSRHDQIFLVLCGHQKGQSTRVDANVNGKLVYQVLADYQDRGQAGIDAGRSKRFVGIGDGWFRLMQFDFSVEPATIRVKTYSSYFGKFSGEVDNYANWYKAREQPNLSDLEFYAADDFIIRLDDFFQRFGKPGNDFQD